MPGRRGDNSKLSNPLSQEERLLMKQLASFAKDNDLLEGRDRKLLFQSGRFLEWFPSTAERLPSVLKELLDDIDDSGKENAIRKIIDQLSKLNPETMVFEKKYADGTITDPELLQLAEAYENQGDLEKALVIAEELHKSNPGNETVRLLFERLRNNS